ncbi:MAG: hypothetical protein AB1324_08405 [Candidatus Micrarchaeota archaeon]
MAPTRKSSVAEKISLRVIVNKPEPDTLPRDAEVLDRILSEGFSYTRYLSRDSVGTERPTMTVKFAVELTRGRNKMELYAFIQRSIGGKSLHEMGTHSEALCDVMMEAEDAGIVRIRESKK